MEAELVPGKPGTFEVDVDGRCVVRKESLGFPTEDDIVDAVGRALGR